MLTFQTNDTISLSRRRRRRSEAVNGEEPIGGGEGPPGNEEFANVETRDGEHKEIGRACPDQIWLAERARPGADDGTRAGDSSCPGIVGVVTVPSLLLLNAGCQH